MFRSSLSRLVGISICVLIAGTSKSAGAGLGWILERDVETPSYAYIEPTSTNLNIDTLVLSCEQGRAGAVLQLHLFLKDGGPLLFKRTLPSQLKDSPRAEIMIDGNTMPAAVYFSGRHVVLADETHGRLPAVSGRLVDAMARGETMTLRLSLATERAGKPTTVHGEAVVDLQAGMGGRAVNVVRGFCEARPNHRVDLLRRGAFDSANDGVAAGRMNSAAPVIDELHRHNAVGAGLAGW